jgi:hypothetical protein
MTTELTLSSVLSPREAEVLADQVSALQTQGTSRFRFLLQKGFLPTIGWLERLRGLLLPLVEKKESVEIVIQPEQKKSLYGAGFHLISDITISNSGL